MSEQEREQEVVAGVLTGIIQKGEDKWQALVRPDGSQYDKKCWTKSPEAKFWLEGRINQRVSLLCGASYWTNNEGKQIRSLWIDRVDVEGAAAVTASPVASPAPGEARVSPSRTSNDKDASIQRQCATKVAVQMLAYLDPQFRTMGKLVDLSNILVTYYETGTMQTSADEIPF